MGMTKELDELQIAQQVFCETMQTLRVVEGPDDRLACKFRMHWQSIREQMEQWDRETMTSPLTKRAFRRDEPDDPYPVIAALQAKVEEWQERARRAEAALASLPTGRAK